MSPAPAIALAPLFVAITMTVGCAPARSDAAAARDAASSGSPADPGRAFEALEARLLGLDAAVVSFRITADGALSAALDGTLVLAGDDRLSLDAAGTFGDRSVRLELEIRDGEMTGGDGSTVFREPAPPHVREAVIIGLTRMGLLHNLARLVAGRAPDRAAGGVTEWVRVMDPGWQPGTGVEGGAGLTFRIMVSGQEAGDAELRVGPAGLPRLRLQTVRFPQGEMRVREEYEWQ